MMQQRKIPKNCNTRGHTKKCPEASGSIKSRPEAPLQVPQHQPKTRITISCRTSAETPTLPAIVVANFPQDVDSKEV